MRETALTILEQYGVDLVLTGTPIPINILFRSTVIRALQAH